MSASIELDRTLHCDHRSDVIFHFCFAIFFQSRIQIGDVALMVLGVVQFHDLGGNHRL